MDEMTKAYREKHWDELNDSEKIERMRGIIKTMEHKMAVAQRNIEKLLMHRHSDNLLMIPIDPMGSWSGEISRHGRE